MIELSFESAKYKLCVSQSQLSTEDKLLINSSIDSYFVAKGAARYSENFQFNCRLTELQEKYIDTIALSPKYSAEAKKLAIEILRQTYIMQNSCL